MPCSVSARDNFSVSASAGRNYPWGLGADDFQTKMLVMFAVIFVDSAHHDAIGARFEIGGKARDPDVRAELHLGPWFLGGSVVGEHFLDERVRPALAFHPHCARSPIRYSTVVRGPPSKKLTTTSVVQVLSWEIGEPNIRPIRESSF